MRWSFCYAKAKNVAAAKAAPGEAADVWTWTAIDADRKLIVSYFVGDRSGQSAIALTDDIRARVANRVQLTTDGHKAYLEAVEVAFGGDVDYAQLIKMYGPTVTAPCRYSPAECIGIKSHIVEGSPDGNHVSTPSVERQNLTMRMPMRRFTRLTNASNKKLDNHIYALTLYFTHYNFCRIHKTHHVSPAMAAAGINDRLWGFDDVLTHVDAAKASKQGSPCNRREAIST